MNNLLPLTKNINNTTVGKVLSDGRLQSKNDYDLSDLFPYLVFATFNPCQFSHDVGTDVEFQFSNLVLLDLKVNHNFGEYKFNKRTNTYFKNLDETLLYFNKIIDVLYKYRKLFDNFYKESQYDVKEYIKKVDDYIYNETANYANECGYYDSDGDFFVKSIHKTKQKIIMKHITTAVSYIDSFNNYSYSMEIKFLEKAILLTINILNGKHEITDEQKKEGIKFYAKLKRYLTSYATNVYNELIYRVLKTNINLVELTSKDIEGYNGYKIAFANPDHFYILKRVELKALNKIIKSRNLNDCEKYGISRLKMRRALTRDIREEFLAKVNSGETDIKLIEFTDKEYKLLFPEG